MPAVALLTKPTGKIDAATSALAHVKSPKLAELRLDALTSLRFFAASMILLLHMSQLFGFNTHTCLEGLALWQGVSFFFVLSGFILAYVYPKIDTAAQSNQFLLARFARIWPTHLAAFLFTVALVPTVMHIPNLIPTAIANLCMVQVWTFNPAMSESFNSVSWTISIELFFYLCFPYLINDFDRPTKSRWVAAAVVSLSFIGLCMLPGILGAASNSLPPSLYLGENPICRLFEFTLGIAACWVFTKHLSVNSLSKMQATCLEVCTLAAIAAAIDLTNLWPAQNACGALSVLRAWAIDMGGAPAYAALILIIASQRGMIAQFLNKKTLVRLGEISFSMYMFHLSILYVLIKYQSSFANLPGWILPAVGVLMCLIVSHLNFTLIETPVRRWIMSSIKEPEASDGSQTQRTAASTWLEDIVFSPPVPIRSRNLRSQPAGGFTSSTLWLDDLTFSPPFPGNVARSSFGLQQLAPSARSSHWIEEFIFSPPRPYSPTIASFPSVTNRRLAAERRAEELKRKQTWVVAEVAAMICLVVWMNVQFRFIPVGVAERIESHSIPTTRDIEFGGRFKLRGLKLSKKPEGLYMDAVWQSLGNERLENLNAVEVIDAKSKTMSAKTYPQDTFNRAVTDGKIWQDKIFIPSEKLKGALRVGLSVHTPVNGKALVANRGVTDGDSVRLLVAIP